ncbi:preprotein translocase subunit YajC [Rhodocyclus tenuis]|uniref:preprotein translocase subunit YajC n=1 Tax=Rhodocyclus tenuis TaxID=1066 RepID=UPI001903B88D|nr:preprotein translocase subunit YajC [Rhodocyclus tenuis]MBK1681061.1 preprotein translocase subunit YajC [Rhodocyclus tenuis]
MLISSAYAQTAAAAADPTGGLMQFLPIILMFVVLYFLMVRPQMKRAKEHKALVDGLAKGDEVVTQGGIAGRVAKVGDNYISLEVAEGVEVQVQKPAVQLVLPKGSLKSL